MVSGWSWARLRCVLPQGCPGADVLVCLQALPYVCLLIAMLFFIYAIIGMQVGATCPDWIGHRSPVAG